MAQSNDATNFEMPINQGGEEDAEKAGNPSGLNFGGSGASDTTAAATGDQLKGVSDLDYQNQMLCELEPYCCMTLTYPTEIS